MRRHVAKIKWLSYALIAASLLVLIRALPLSEGVSAVRSWVAGLGVWGPLVFGLIYIAAVLAMVPASLLTLAAGATFGLLVGTITVSLASTIGAALALLIARYLARSRVEQFVQQRPRFAAIDQAIREGGWKIVAMLRLSPAVPFNVQNYLYGLTSIGFWTCVLTSWLAMLPGTFLYVYLGYAAGSVTGGSGSRSPAEWAALGVGLLATLGVSVYITRLAQRKLREQTAIAGNETLSDDTQTSPLPEPDAAGSTPTSVLAPVVIALVFVSLAGVTLIHPQEVSQALRAILPLGPPPVTMTEQYAQDPGTAKFDHSTFDRLLHEFDADGGWVDYDGLSQHPDQLDAYLQSLATAPFEQLGRDGKLALLINAYNAFTLRLILDHWPLKSIKDIPAAQRWADKRWNVGGNIWSLEQIEHEQIRPKFQEPRVHFALVCAAVGCPPLAGEAYVADRLESQLQRQAEYVHTHHTWLQLDVSRRTVALTPLYQWYRGDFEQSARSIVDYAARFNADLRQLIEMGKPLDVSFLPYDWSLNSRANRQPR